MAQTIQHSVQLPPEQEAIRAKCFYPGGTDIEFPIEDVETSIPARFEKIVRQYPDCIAVKTETHVVTYKQLNDMANWFARAVLRREGPRAQLVGLLLEKDVAQVAAMLGVMKTGKFFLILDPTFPKARLAAMLKDSRAKLVVTNHRNVILADEITNRDREFMEWEAIDRSVAGDNPDLSIAPKALAFINYTSGSTGEPKGLLRTHRMILHNIMLRSNLIHVCEHDRISLLSSGTSNAITNSLLALLNGAGLYSLEVKKVGVVRLASWLAEENITIAPMSSPLFRGLCETLKGSNNFPNLRIIRLRSEAVYKSDADLYKRFFSPNCVFVTGLSSNETGPLADYLIDHDTVVDENAVPVGYAAPGKQVVLINEVGEKIGIDEVGEIVVRSRYLSPGYLRNPRLAKAKFKRDPSENGSRVYLTGDLGLMLSDGCLIHKGRRDFRVKIRGYPVDLKEVETALRTHPGIRDSVITARTNRLGETALVAYFVTASHRAPTVSELVRFLAQKLPDYMIPASFVRLESVPLSPHNKVDRTALPLPAETRPNLDSAFMEPRCEVERQLAQIWAEVLGIDRVGIHDRFFELGGHSLAATRIVSRVIDKFRLELPPQSLFDSPTVEAMAAVISQNQGFDHKPREHFSHQSSAAVDARPVEPTIDFTPFPKDEVERSAPERFEKIVARYPNRIAVKAGHEAVTYSRLNAMANRLAHAIVDRRGTEAEAVAILMDNGARLMAAMLAVLKAGKFFVLLDRSSPHARLAHILEVSQAHLIISERQYAEVTPHCNSADFHLLDFDSISSQVAEENLGLSFSPSSLATIIFTSGSTGDPKGVIWAQRNLLHQVMLFTNAYKLSESDKLLLTSSGTGNAVLIEFLALLNGAALLPFDVQSQGVDRLIKWLLDEQITICWVGSPLFRNICHALNGEERFPDVRILRLASEAAYKSDIELYKQHFTPKCILINGLSITESGSICLYPIDFKTEIPSQEVPVGYPLKDKEILLLDDAGKEVGANEAGEIAVRSRYLSPGYWHRPELTASKFNPDPSGVGQRIYLSGDLGLMRPDGCLIHKGRKDFRVKIRGYGVEPAEIEKVLNSHAAIGQAVVVARAKETGEARLIACYTCTGLRIPTVSELRSFLRERLPDFMIPSAFVMLEALPLTHSGKVDRRALPDPDNVRPELATPYLSSRNEIEQTLVKTWEAVLDVRPVGVNDEFLDLGGDSLSAGRIISQVTKRFQLEIPLQSLFQSPTIADMASLIAEHQGELSGIDKQDHVAGPSLVPGSREKQLPLSFSQQRLWFLDQLEPGSFTFNLFSAYRLRGKLDVAALEQSFNEILRRHEVLRSVFNSKDGRPQQVVLPTLAVRIPIYDLRKTVSEESRGTEVRRLSRAEAQRPFDLASGPLLRITLLRLADDEYVLLRAIHHIVSDGWSEGVLFRELAAIYQAFTNGKSSPLAALAVQYADYAAWQRQWFQGERLENQASYWKNQLENLPTLQLPTDRPRLANQSPRGERRYFALSYELSSGLRTLSNQHGATLFMTLLAGFQTLLHRYSGQTDIVIGAPVAGRSRREFEELIGFFLNTLVLRLDLSGNPTFAEVVSRTRQVCLGALSHQELPFEKLVEELHPDRNLGQNPLFQASFAFQNTPRFFPHLSNVEVDELEVDSGIARFDLHLFMEEQDGDLKGYCDYDINLFDADTIERLLGHFQRLLESVVKNPDQCVTDIPILTAAEKHQLLGEWNDTRKDYSKDKCVHELFAEQVKRTPDAIAVVFEDQRLNYRELNRRANQLAHYLRAQGVRREDLVGICMERSLEMVVGILGILKAGGAYVPLDPEYPQERLAFMLEDTQAGVLLTQERLIGKFPNRGARVACLDRDWDSIGQQSDENPTRWGAPGNLAYVIYTSGSTGKPKGCMNTHLGVSNRLLWMQDAYHLDGTDRVLQKTPFSFDVSVWEFFWPLLTGATEVVARPGGHQDPDHLAKLIVEQNITTIHFVPSMLQAFLEEDGAQKCRSLRRVFCSGEALPFELQQRFFASSLDAELHSLYGPTEAAVDVSYWACAREDNRGSVPIGRPVANTKIYILDSQLNPVPVGVGGELYLGGVQLARGYLNRPALTAEQFIPNPFSHEPGTRLYKTGDLARYLPDGNIEFLGRIDHQVKIRGFRIELGEIEAALRQHPAVRETVVVAREDTPEESRVEDKPKSKTCTELSRSIEYLKSQKRMVAYVVPKQKPAPTIHELRSFLPQKLPDYMAPSAFVFLDALPLTPSGKVDRNALPAPSDTRPDLEERYLAPRTPMEQVLADIWAALLKVDKVGIHDNFFDLGGHSLLATQVVARIRNEFRIDFPLRTLFERPTIEGLANAIVAPNLHDAQPEAIASVLDQVESLSDDEIEQQLFKPT